MSVLGCFLRDPVFLPCAVVTSKVGDVFRCWSSEGLPRVQRAWGGYVSFSARFLQRSGSPRKPETTTHKVSTLVQHLSPVRLERVPGRFREDSLRDQILPVGDYDLELKSWYTHGRKDTRRRTHKERK